MGQWGSRRLRYRSEVAAEVVPRLTAAHRPLILCSTVALPEGWGLDSTPVLTEIALATRQIRLASGVLSVWGRTPATLAMTAATLHDISGGRYVLGLGASTSALVEGFHDTAFAHPAAKLREVTTKVRELLELWDGVADVVMIGLPPGLSWPSIEATLRTAAP